MSDPVEHPPLLLNRRQTAQTMGISIRLLDQIVKEQRLPFVKLNRRVLFDPQDIRMRIAANKSGAAE
jgi:hypothetical protein